MSDFCGRDEIRGSDSDYEHCHAQRKRAHFHSVALLGSETKIKFVKKHGSLSVVCLYEMKIPGSRLCSNVSGSWLRGVTRKEAGELRFFEKVFSLSASQASVSWDKEKCLCIPRSIGDLKNN